MNLVLDDVKEKMRGMYEYLTPSAPDLTPVRHR